MKVCCVFWLESPRRGDSNENTHHTIIIIKKKENHPKWSKIALECFWLGTQQRVRNIRGKRAISVRATEGLLYFK